MGNINDFFARNLPAPKTEKTPKKKGVKKVKNPSAVKTPMPRPSKDDIA